MSLDEAQGGWTKEHSSGATYRHLWGIRDQGPSRPVQVGQVRTRSPRLWMAPHRADASTGLERVTTTCGKQWLVGIPIGQPLGWTFSPLNEIAAVV